MMVSSVVTLFLLFTKVIGVFLYSDCVYIVFILVSIYFIPLLSHEIPIYTLIKIQNSTPPDLT